MQAYPKWPKTIIADSYCRNNYRRILLSTQLLLILYCWPFIVDFSLSTPYFLLFMVDSLLTILIVDSLLSTLYCPLLLSILYCMSTVTVYFYWRLFIVNSYGRTFLVYSIVELLLSTLIVEYFELWNIELINKKSRQYKSWQ